MDLHRGGMFSMHRDPRKVTNILLSIARQAGKIARESQRRGISKDRKEGLVHSDEIVTSADLEVQDFAASEAQKAFNGVPVVAEEKNAFTGVDEEEFISLDPIDGTLSFSEGGCEWGVLISFISEHKVLSSVLHNPCRDFSITAAAGCGCTLNGNVLTVPPSERPSLIISFGPWTSGRSIETMTRLEKKGFSIVKAVSAIDGYRRLFLGEGSVYIGDKEKIWESAPSSLAVTEAGGFACPLDEDEYDFRKLIIPHVISFSEDHVRQVLETWREDR